MKTHLRVSVFCSVLVLFLIQAAALASPASEGRLALVIGNGNYTAAPLKNPVHDADDMAAALQKLGFTVILKKDVNLRAMEESIRDFGKRLKKGGVGLFYYAGHGLQVGGVNYLVPVGVRIEQESDVKYETVDAGRVLDTMGEANNGLNVVVLDACRDNPFARKFRRMDRGLGVMDSAPAGMFVAYSTGAGQVALDGEGRNSPFAAALIRFIKEPGLTIEQVFKKVRQKLNADTGGKQIPWELSSLAGDFYFAAARSVTVRPAGPEEAGDKPAQGAGGMKRSEAGLPKNFTDPKTGLEFVLVPGGCFQMGDTFGEGGPHEIPHEVCLDGFYMGKFEVTQALWEKIMGENPAHFKKCGGSCPVESVSWTAVQEFISELNRVTGQKYRLPTEAEWEYASRGGGRKEKFAGTSSDVRLREYAWHDTNSDDKLHPVGQKEPNSLGIHDMSGNVWEWVQDYFSESYYRESPRDNPAGPAEGTERVLRGCSWLDRRNDCRVTQRLSLSPSKRFVTIGFRLVKPL